MTTWKDIWVYNGILACGYISSLCIFNLSFVQKHLPYTFLIPLALVITAIIIRQKLKDRKRVGELLKKDFTAMNYTILCERPLNFKEQLENLELDFGPFLNGMSINSLRYKNRMKRYFMVRNENNYNFELIVGITQTWGDKIRYDIESRTRIRD